MGIKEEIAAFDLKLDTAIDEIMTGQMTETAKDYIAIAVETEVYDAYPNPIIYERKKGKGGLSDKSNMDSTYEKATHTLEVFDTRKDGTRDVVKIVETGVGYEFKPGPGSESDGAYLKPRPFHSVAEENIERDNALETILEIGLSIKGFDVK